MSSDVCAVVLGRVTTDGPLVPPKRKLIAAPRITLDAEDDDDDDLSDIPPSSPPLSSHFLGGSAPSTMRRGRNQPRSLAPPSSSKASSSSSSQVSRLAYDLATYVSSSLAASSDRRHSICVCETPVHLTPPPGAPVLRSASSASHNTPASLRPVLVPQPSSGPPGCSSMPPVHRTHSNASSTASAISSSSSPANVLISHSQNQRDFLRSAHFASHLDCLSLTLEEVVHIRNVLTKADLEALPLDLTIKEDMAKGKICFLCMKVRFSFFGHWAVECRLCKRNVCKKCVSKMRIPAEHFGNIPVLMLSPQAFSPREEEEDVQNTSFPRQLFNRLQDLPKSASERRVSVSCSVGSAPSSPTLSPRSGPPYSLPTHTPDSPPYVHEDIKRKQEQRELLRHQAAAAATPQLQCHKEQLRGELMSVCGDCKAMMLHVLLSIKLRREQHQSRAKTPSPPPPLPHHIPPRHHLHLNLTPVYN
ncbi:Zinc finger FYVE/PHD-type [Trinorchestia longiramus]|nr:Zinc finger FYVE/PHD-type [Trinorchestia longiramus]